MFDKLRAWWYQPMLNNRIRQVNLTGNNYDEASRQLLGDGRMPKWWNYGIGRQIERGIQLPDFQGRSDPSWSDAAYRSALAQLLVPGYVTKQSSVDKSAFALPAALGAGAAAFGRRQWLKSLARSGSTIDPAKQSLTPWAIGGAALGALTPRLLRTANASLDRRKLFNTMLDYAPLAGTAAAGYLLTH